MSRSTKLPPWFVAAFVLLGAGLLTNQQEVATQGSAASQASSALRIAAIDVQPAVAAPDTLSKLKVRIRNDGSLPVSHLTFDVTVSSQRLAPYLNHVFLNTLQPGKETEVSLYNFWTSEAGRPFPKDGRLVVEVRLTGAEWIGKGNDAATRSVKPLPPPLTLTLTQRKSP
jgi:archaellin